MSPSSSDATCTPTQKATYTIVGARLSTCWPVPKSPAYAVTAKTRTPSTPRTTSTARGRRTSRRSGQACRRGRDHMPASARNDATSTTAAAAMNSPSGTGRSARPTRPWAMTSTAVESRNGDGPAVGRGRRCHVTCAERLRPAGGVHTAGDRRRHRGAVEARREVKRPGERVTARLAARRRHDRVLARLPREGVAERGERRVEPARLTQLLRDGDGQLAPADLAAHDGLHAAARLVEVEEQRVRVLDERVHPEDQRRARRADGGGGAADRAGGRPTRAGGRARGDQVVEVAPLEALARHAHGRRPAELDVADRRRRQVHRHREAQARGLRLLRRAC